MASRTDNFQKFVKQKKGSAIKEEIRQDKKKAKKERAAAIEEHFAKKRAERLQQNPPPAKKAPFNKDAKRARGKGVEKTAEASPTTSSPKISPDKGTKKAPPSKGTKKAGETSASTETMPVNKYIAHSGICSRRDAAVLVKEGKVIVNGEVATDPGMKVSSTDVVKVSGKKATPSRNFVYILLNKPKDYITTLEDPQGRKTVLDLIRQATTERVYPVGRLDRNTSGVLLLTNDGELAQKLSHPKHEIKKVYEVRLDRALTKGDMDTIANGVTLEDGFVAPDVIAYADAKDKSIIGIEIHSGRNRIVRRIFEHLKYDVKALDRVMFAGLTKKNVQRGKWRLLTDKELRILKFMNQSFVKIKE
jgi:23S rRNA pseudouridine2605 synthase